MATQNDEFLDDEGTADPSEEARDDVQLGKLARPSERTARYITEDIRRLRLLRQEAFDR